MNNRTDEQLSRVMQAYVSATPPSPDLPSIHEPRRSTIWTKPAFAAAGAFALVILVGSGLVLIASLNSADEASEVAATPVLNTTNPPVAEFAGPINLSWTSLRPDGADGVVFNAIAAGGGRLVAGGTRGAVEAEDSPNMASIWISDDGREWSRIVDPSFMPEPGWIDVTSTIASIRDVAYGVGGFVAVGQMGSDGALWTSPSGTDWTRLGTQQFGGKGLQELTGVTPGVAGWVAIGRSESEGKAWASPDGQTWQLIEDLEGAHLSAVVTTPAGFTALGEKADRGAIWVSSDGIKWDLAGATTFIPVYPRNGFIAVDPNDGSFIGLDYYGVWASEDGSTWTKVHEYDGFSTPTHPDGIAIWYEDRIVAADADTGLWSSSDDGANWTRLDDDSALDGGVAELLEYNGNLIAVGDSIWIGRGTS